MGVKVSRGAQGGGSGAGERRSRAQVPSDMGIGASACSSAPGLPSPSGAAFSSFTGCVVGEERLAEQRPAADAGLRIMTAGGSWLWPRVWQGAVSVLWARPEPWVRSLAPACPELAEGVSKAASRRG